MIINLCFKITTSVFNTFFLKTWYPVTSDDMYDFKCIGRDNAREQTLSKVVGNKGAKKCFPKTRMDWNLIKKLSP